jgi:hypothetical protein
MRCAGKTGSNRGSIGISLRSYEEQTSRQLWFPFPKADLAFRASRGMDGIDHNAGPRPCERDAPAYVFSAVVIAVNARN